MRAFLGLIVEEVKRTVFNVENTTIKLEDVVGLTDRASSKVIVLEAVGLNEYALVGLNDQYIGWSALLTGFTSSIQLSAPQWQQNTGIVLHQRRVKIALISALDADIIGIVIDTVGCLYDTVLFVVDESRSTFCTSPCLGVSHQTIFSCPNTYIRSIGI